MNYEQYICKKRFKGNCICGNVNIPFGTILNNSGGFLTNEKHEIICATTSQVCKDYFWGYDITNPKGEIERQEVVKLLTDVAPQEDFDILHNATTTWKNYGHLEEFINGGYIWEWYPEVYDFDISRLNYLLKCVVGKIQPIY